MGDGDIVGINAWAVILTNNSAANIIISFFTHLFLRAVNCHSISLLCQGVYFSFRMLSQSYLSASTSVPSAPAPIVFIYAGLPHPRQRAAGTNFGNGLGHHLVVQLSSLTIRMVIPGAILVDEYSAPERAPRPDELSTGAAAFG